MPGIDSPANRAFAAAVAGLRAKQKLTQEELAERSGGSQRWLSKIERVEKHVQLNDVVKLAKGLKMPLGTLLEIWQKFL